MAKENILLYFVSAIKKTAYRQASCLFLERLSTHFDVLLEVDDLVGIFLIHQ